MEGERSELLNNAIHALEVTTLEGEHGLWALKWQQFVIRIVIQVVSDVRMRAETLDGNACFISNNLDAMRNYLRREAGVQLCYDQKYRSRIW